MSETLTANTIRVTWLAQLDRILRGESTSPRELFRDSFKNADIPFSVGGLAVVLGALGALYGIMKGLLAMVRGVESCKLEKTACQVTANLFKVPLFVPAVDITFPSLNPVVVRAELTQTTAPDRVPLEVSLSPASSEGNSSAPLTAASVFRRGRIIVVFWCWMIAFGLVGVGRGVRS